MREWTSKGSWHKILKSKLSFKPSEPGYKAWCKDHHLEWASYIGIHGNHSDTGTSFNWAGPMCKKTRGPYGLAWRTLMTRAHILRKENFVSSKARVLNQLNKRTVAPGAEVRAQFKQMYKMHQSWPKKKEKKNHKSTFFPKLSCLHLKVQYWFWADCHKWQHLGISWIAAQMCCHYITAQYGSQYSII